MTVLFYLTITIFLALCALLCFVILIQESKSMGLGSSFGGDSGNSLFGTSTADVLKKFTAYLAVVFVALCIILSLWTSVVGRSKPKTAKTTIEQVQN